MTMVERVGNIVVASFVVLIFIWVGGYLLHLHFKPWMELPVIFTIIFILIGWVGTVVYNIGND
jgi:uncharacterized membrane protein